MEKRNSDLVCLLEKQRSDPPMRKEVPVTLRSSMVNP